MARVRECRACGVPYLLGSYGEWTTAGTISSKREKTERYYIYDAQAIRKVLSGIEAMIGMDIERIVIESRRRRTFDIWSKSLPKWQSALFSVPAKELSQGGIIAKVMKRPFLGMVKLISDYISGFGLVLGFGRTLPGEGWKKREPLSYRNMILRNPYCLPMVLGDMLGAIEFLEKRDLQVEYEAIGEEEYKVALVEGGHPLELSDRLKREPYDIKKGSISFDKCSKCGVPVEISSYAWDYEKGTVVDPESGDRLFISEVDATQAVLDDLESELGEAIPKMVIDTQREYLKPGAKLVAWKNDEVALRHSLALRGMGNLVRFEMSEAGLDVTVENACLPPLLVGAAQALFEKTYDKAESTREWRFEEDGVLSIAIR